MVLGSGVAAHYVDFVSHTPKASGNKHAIGYLALEIHRLHAALNLPFHRCACVVMIQSGHYKSSIVVCSYPQVLTIRHILWSIITSAKEVTVDPKNVLKLHIWA
jgi:hypothetical protein